MNSGKSSIFDRVVYLNTVGKEYGQITQKNKVARVESGVLAEKYPALKNLKNVHINFVDTPGHALFRSLQLRSIQSADIILLIHDCSQDWSGANTSNLKLALELGKPVIVIVNKVDKKLKITSKKLKEELQHNEDLNLMLYRIQDTIASIPDFPLQNLSTVCDGFSRVKPGHCLITAASAVSGFGISQCITLAVLSGEVDSLTETVQGALGYIFEVDWASGEVWHTLYCSSEVVSGETYKIGDSMVIVKRMRADRLIDGKWSTHTLTSCRDQFCKCILLTDDISRIQPGMILSIKGRHSASEGLQSQNQTIVTGLNPSEGVFIKCMNHGELEAISTELEREKIPIFKVSFGPLTQNETITYLAYSKNNYRLLVSTDPKFSRIAPSHLSTLTDPHIPNLIKAVVKWRDLLQAKSRAENRKKFVELPVVVLLLWNCVFNSDPLIVGVEVLAGVLKPKTVLRLGQSIMHVKSLCASNSPVEQVKVGDSAAVQFADISKVTRLQIIGKLKTKDRIILHSIIKIGLQEMQEFLEGPESRMVQQALGLGWTHYIVDK